MNVSFAEDMRRIDGAVEESYGLPAAALMENAGRRSAEEAAQLIGGAAGKVFAVFAGGGNNGGDAFAAARHLINMGARVKMFFIGAEERLSPAAHAMHSALRAMGIEIRPLAGDRDWDRLRVSLRFADAVVDGILGTGVKGELRKTALRLIEEINAAGKPTLAIDIPSGVEADTGRIASIAVRADRTLALGLPKVGHFLGQGANAAGELLVDDIGIPHALLAGEGMRQSLITQDAAAKLLAEMTGCTAVIQDVEPTRQRLTGFDIVHLSNHDALAVLTLDESKPVTVQFAIPKNFLSSDLEILHKLVQERFLGNTVLDIHYRLRTEIPQIVQKYFKITDNVLDLFDYIFSQLFKELIFIEGKVASLTYADLKTYQFLDNPQHVALELRSAISDDEVTKISVAESTEEALENVTVMSHKFLIPYRGMALMHVIGPVEMDYRRMVSLVNVISRVLVMKLTDYYRYLNSNHYEVS